MGTQWVAWVMLGKPTRLRHVMNDLVNTSWSGSSAVNLFKSRSLDWDTAQIQWSRFGWMSRLGLIWNQTLYLLARQVLVYKRKLYFGVLSAFSSLVLFINYCMTVIWNLYYEYIYQGFCLIYGCRKPMYIRIFGSCIVPSLLLQFILILMIILLLLIF
jgi:hypothetical protein